MKLSKPNHFALLQGLILVQAARVAGLSFILVGLRQGILPASFAIPAGIGDTLIALTAPLVVLAIRRGALLAWAAAITWNALGLTDFAVAFTEGFASQASAMQTLPWVLIPTVAVPVFTVVHLVSMALLVRRPMRSYFAQRDTSLE